MKDYLEEAKRVQDEIWSLVDVGSLRVVDIGVGESTEQLAKRGAIVVRVDKDVGKAEEGHRLGVLVVVCDFLCPPFSSRVADLVVFYFHVA